MIAVLALLLWPGAVGRPAWSELALSIEKDRSTSSDTVTLCRVRVVNNGRHTWAGRDLVFEARALEGSVVAARQRGRFGLVLGPHETLETLVAFLGLYERFEVKPAFSAFDGERKKHRRKSSGSARRKTRNGKRKGE